MIVRHVQSWCVSFGLQILKYLLESLDDRCILEVLDWDGKYAIDVIIVGNKKTLLNSSARFLDKSGNAAGSVTVTDNVGTVTSYDNGPGSTTTTVT